MCECDRTGDAVAGVAGPQEGGVLLCAECGRRTRSRSRFELRIPTAAQPAWERRYVRAARCSDLFSVLVADLVVTLGYHDASVLSLPSNALVALSVPVLALFSLALAHAWDPRVLGGGPEEFRRVGSAYVAVIAAMAVLGYAVGLAGGHSWVFGAFPLAAALTLLGRYGLRRWVHRRRRSGKYRRSVVAAGDAAAVRELIRRTRAAQYVGWHVAAVCLADVERGQALPMEVDGVPVIGTERDVVGLVALHGFQAVAILPSSRWSQNRTQQLAWDLEAVGADLLMTPALMDIVGPRLHITPVAGMPLLQVNAPTFTGPAWVVKMVLDRVFALVLLVVSAPVLLTIGCAVRLTSPGPALFRQTRVGQGGTRFQMVKFRSMVCDAEERRADLVDADEGAGALFKIRNDPRVTRVGHFLRRYSLDELPQLLNVVAGHMSLVGPRPPLVAEVETYDDGVCRRLFVKPGVTGLWQVSGRSDLSWEESVRIDLRYVENWSIALDVMILWKTVAAVFRAEGAY